MPTCISKLDNTLVLLAHRLRPRLWVCFFARGNSGGTDTSLSVAMVRSCGPGQGAQMETATDPVLLQLTLCYSKEQ